MEGMKAWLHVPAALDEPTSTVRVQERRPTVGVDQRAVAFLVGEEALHHHHADQQDMGDQGALTMIDVRF